MPNLWPPASRALGLTSDFPMPQATQFFLSALPRSVLVGILIIPAILVPPHINAAGDEASGRIVRVLPEWHARGASLYVVYPSSKNVPARVAAFRDFVVAAFASWKAGRDGAATARARR